jgi:hypothetical protein
MSTHRTSIWPPFHIKTTTSQLAAGPGSQQSGSALNTSQSSIKRVISSNKLKSSARGDPWTGLKDRFHGRNSRRRSTSPPNAFYAREEAVVETVSPTSSTEDLRLEKRMLPPDVRLPPPSPKPPKKLVPAPADAKKVHKGQALVYKPKTATIKLPRGLRAPAKPTPGQLDPQYKYLLPRPIANDHLHRQIDQFYEQFQNDCQHFAK